MSAWHINQAVRVIQSGGVLAYPTETVFGLGCSPGINDAVERVLHLKHRKLVKGLILVGGDISQFRHMVDLERIPDKNRVLETWPGPVTWILPAKPGVSGLLRGNSTGLAVRISAHPLIQAVCHKTGVLVSTSANPAGFPPARDAWQVRRYFHNKLDFIYPGRCDPEAKPSEIRDAMSGNIIRSAH